MADLAKLSWSGGSQTVHLPPEYHFDGAEVRIRREGERVILEPVSNDVADSPEDEAEKLEWLREAIREGLEGDDEEWDVEEIKRAGRALLQSRS